MSADSLFTASWLFFAIWSIVVGTISIAAFGHDLIPSKVRSSGKPGVGHKT